MDFLIIIVFVLVVILLIMIAIPKQVYGTSESPIILNEVLSDMLSTRRVKTPSGKSIPIAANVNKKEG